VTEATRSGVQVIVAETATARLPRGTGDVSVVDVGCFPSPTGDDPLSRALAVGRLLLPESAMEIPVSCPSAEEVVDALMGETAGGFEPHHPRPLREVLDGVDVKIVPDGMPGVAAAVLAKLTGALYWPLSTWSEYRALGMSDGSLEEQGEPQDSIDSSGGKR
jgi:hypothetical protein